jgi:hypothetical protein
VGPATWVHLKSRIDGPALLLAHQWLAVLRGLTVGASGGEPTVVECRRRSTRVFTWTSYLLAPGDLVLRGGLTVGSLREPAVVGAALGDPWGR